jgi:hypothetical protein
MSHELRTPFRSVAIIGPLAVPQYLSHSSFYGLLDLLGGTELTAGQSEIGDFDFSFPADDAQSPDSADCEAVLRVATEGGFILHDATYYR